MQKSTSATLDYISNLQKTILSQRSDIKRKNKLLKLALDQLLMQEWEVNIGVVADLESELAR